jgi:hypothetical protein
MAVDYMEVMSALAGMMSKHPQTSSLGMQTYSMWSEHIGEAKKIYEEYQRASAAATGKLDQVGILMQLMAMHPKVSDLLVQTLAMWSSRIEDAKQLIQEFQAASVAAYKS